MKRHRTAVFALAALMLFSTGCRPGSGQEEEPLRIGVAVYEGTDTYIKNMTESMQCYADDWSQEGGRPIYLSVFDGRESQSTQNEQIDRMVSLGYDVLCVNLVDRTDASNVVNKARTADIPVVFFNREPVQEDLESWDKAYYVGSDAHQSAQLQAQIVLDLWGEDRSALDLDGDGILQYVILEGESRHQDAMIRTEVSVQALREGGIALEQLGSGIANWDRSQAAALTERLLTEHPDVELILCNNDDMALGAADAVERLGLDFHNIVGIDGIPEGLEAVEEGRLLGTVVMDYDAHGETILRLAVALATGEDVSEVAEVEAQTVLIPMYIEKNW